METTEEIAGEEWREIQGMPQYLISSLGRVFSKVSGKILKPCLNNKYFSIRIGRHGKWQRLHRLVALHFIPNPENKPHVNHINAVKTDNRLCNLEWCTPSENIKHAYNLGNFNQTGSRNGAAKLSELEVVQIKRLLRSGTYQRLIAEEFNVSRGAILNIKRGKSWSFIKEEI